MQKILFLNGPSQDPSDRFFGWPTSLLYAIAPTIDAIHRGSLNMAYAEQVFDPWCYIEGQNSDRVISDFRKCLQGVDILCASAIYDSLFPTLRLFAEAKRLNPKIITILGGPHFDEVHSIKHLNDISRWPDLIDYAIAGDGEWILLELLRELSKGKSANSATATQKSLGQGWLYDNRGNCFGFNKPLSLDDLPFMPVELAPKRHRLDFDVFNDDGQILPTVQMIAMRGCPYSCTYCSERKELACPNPRSISHIMSEIALRKQQGFEAVFFDDSTFGAYPKLKELLREFSGSGMRYGSLNRFNHLSSPKTLEMYRQAGFEYLYCSIEQFDDDALGKMKKGQRVRHIEKSLPFFKELRIRLGVSLLYGLPYETQDSIQATLDFTQKWVEEGVIVLVSESVLSYHPGTPEGQGKVDTFDRTPPHIGHPWNRFEEGQWYHPEHVTVGYLNNILQISEERFSQVMVRNRHSWAAKKQQEWL